MEWLIGASVLTTLGALGMLALAASLALPLAWLWMLIDAAVRQEWEYPGGTATSQNRAAVGPAHPVRARQRGVLLLLRVPRSAARQQAAAGDARSRRSARADTPSEAAGPTPRGLFTSRGQCARLSDR